jgi:signal transduction histidine kinase
MSKLLRSSFFLMSINILVLGLFLWFWLRGEYRTEKAVLMQQAGLQVAEQLIMIGGLDLDSILLDFQNQLGDSFQLDQKGSRVIRKEFGTLPHSHEMRSGDDRHTLAAGDTVINLSLFNEEIRPGDSLSASYSIVISDETGHLKLDSMNITANLRDDYLEQTEDISRQALANIRPQIGFALLLFAISLLAIYLLQKLLRERQSALEAKDTMIANLTHELQTPVSTIGVALEAIQEFDVQKDAQKTQAYLQTSRLELTRLSRLVDQILQFSKIDQGVARLDFQKTEVGELLEECVNGMTLQANARKAEIELLPIPQEWQITADRLQLKSVFVNLLDNSLKYGPEGVKIRIQVNRERQNYHFRFSDNGPGIPKEYQTKVFERFFRISHGDTHNVKGSGLGLSYVREIVQAHGGSTTLASTENAGTLIHVYLPISHGEN